MFTDRLHQDTDRLGLNTIRVDASMTADDLTTLVTTTFGSRTAPGRGHDTSHGTDERHTVLDHLP
jgi:hypothetical protein